MAWNDYDMGDVYDRDPYGFLGDFGDPYNQRRTSGQTTRWGGTEPYTVDEQDPYAAIRQATQRDPFIGVDEQGPPTLFDPYTTFGNQQANQNLYGNRPPQAQTPSSGAAAGLDLLRREYPLEAPTASTANRPAPVGPPPVNQRASLFDDPYGTQQSRVPPPVTRPTISAPPQRRIASPTAGRTQEPIIAPPTPVQNPVQAPSYTRQEPTDFASLLSGAAQKGTGVFGQGLGDFGAAGMQGPEERARIAAEEERRRNLPQMPKYDYGPMTRYQEYLKAEPNKGDYRPTGLSRFLNAASAGIQGYRTGNVAEGVKLGEYLNERPYQEAFKNWQSKGTRVAADATMAETRYKNAVEAYNKQEDNRRQDYLAQVTAKGLELKQAEFLWKVNEAKNNGWQEVTGQDGMAYLRKVVDGKVELMPTGMPAKDLNAIQKIALEEAKEEGRNARHDRASGSSRLGAQTSMFNTQNTINAANQRQLNQFDFTGGQTRYVQNETNRRAGVGPGVGTRSVTASALSDPLTTVTQGFKEFNSPAFMKITKGARQSDPPKIELMSDEVAKAEIKKLSGGNPELAAQYYTRWLQMKGYLGVK